MKGWNIMQQKLALVVAWLRVLAKPLEGTRDYVHWIAARNAEKGQEPDHSFSYCKQCCETAVEALNEHNSEAEYLVDGGWPSDADCLCSCHVCGKELDVTLTPYGLEEESSYFAHNGIKLRGPRKAHVAYALCLILESVSCYSLTTLENGATKQNIRVILKKLQRIHRRSPASEALI